MTTGITSPQAPEGPRATRPWMETFWLLYIAFNVFMIGWIFGGVYGERPARFKRAADEWQCLAWQAVYSNAEARGTLNLVAMEGLRPAACAHMVATATTTEPQP